MSLFGPINIPMNAYNNYRVYGTILCVLMFVCVFIGVKFVSKFSPIALFCVIVSILCVYIGIFVSSPGRGPRFVFGQLFAFPKLNLLMVFSHGVIRKKWSAACLILCALFFMLFTNYDCCYCWFTVIWLISGCLRVNWVQWYVCCRTLLIVSGIWHFSFRCFALQQVECV